MTNKWEYRYIELMRSEGQGFFTADTGEVFGGFAVELANAGAEGWEAVGPVTVWTQKGNVPTTKFLLKREAS